MASVNNSNENTKLVNSGLVEISVDAGLKSLT